jgi:hypothetical protein
VQSYEDVLDTVLLILLASVAKTTVEFRLVEVESERCVAHPSNPKIIEIKDRILKVGGVLEPVKAVLGTTGDDRYRLLGSPGLCCKRSSWLKISRNPLSD